MVYLHFIKTTTKRHFKIQPAIVNIVKCVLRAGRTVCVCVCIYDCVYSTFAVLLPVHNWWCASNLHKLPIYSHTSSHKHKKHKIDIALAEKRQHKQQGPCTWQPTHFHFEMPTPHFRVFVSTSISPCLPSYLSLFFAFPPAPSFLFLYFLSPTSLYLSYVPLITHAPCPLLPLCTPPPTLPPTSFQLSLPSPCIHPSSSLIIPIQYVATASKGIQFTWDSVKNNCIFMSVHNKERQKRTWEGFKQYVKV